MQVCKNLPWYSIRADTELASHRRQLRQEDVEGEGQTVVDGVDVGTEPIQDSTRWSYVEKGNLKIFKKCLR